MPPKHILIVDDDPLILEVLARALASPQFRVSTARRVALATDILRRQTVDLVIADARLPGESGLQFVQAAREIGVPSILMSGEPEWALEHGLPADQYVSKPFDLYRLRHLVRTALASGGDIDVLAVT